MRSYVLAREPDGLKSDLGTGAADAARIVSEIRDRVQVELRPPGETLTMTDGSYSSVYQRSCVTPPPSSPCA